MSSTMRRWVVGWLALAVLAVISTAMWRREPAAPQVAAAARPLTLAVSTAYIGAGLVTIADKRGLFAAEGLQVTIQPHTSGRSALESLLAGRADFATVGDTPFMFAVVRGQPVVIVGTLATAVRSHGVVARRDRGIGTLADLRGKTVGLTFGTDGDFLLSMLMAAQRVDPRSVRTVGLKPEELAPALAAGSVDAVSTWDPWLSAARKQAGPQAVSFSPASGFSFWFHLVGGREAVAADPKVPVKVLRALAAAERFLGEHPAQGRDIVAKATGMDAEMFAQTWPRFELQLKLPQALLTMLEDQTRWAQANGHVEGVEMPNFLDAIYLPAMLAVHPQSVSIVR